MLIVSRPNSTVLNIIDEIAALNPDFTTLKLSPENFVYFIRSLGSNTKLFCDWKDKKNKVLHYYTGVVDIDVQINNFISSSKIYFNDSKGKLVMEIDLSI